MDRAVKLDIVHIDHFMWRLEPFVAEAPPTKAEFLAMYLENIDAYPKRSWAEIAKLTGYKEKSVAPRAHQLGFRSPLQRKPRGQMNDWGRDEIIILVLAHRRGCSFEQIAHLLKRTRHACAVKHSQYRDKTKRKI